MNSSPPMIPSLPNVPASMKSREGTILPVKTNYCWLKPRKQMFRSEHGSPFIVPHGTKIAVDEEVTKLFSYTTTFDGDNKFLTPRPRKLVSVPNTSTPSLPVLPSHASHGHQRAMPRAKLQPRKLSKSFWRES